MSDDRLAQAAAEVERRNPGDPHWRDGFIDGVEWADDDE